MKRYYKLFRFISQFIKFGIVGVSNTAISLTIYYLFIWMNKELYITGNSVGFLISILNAYYWNNKYVFHKKVKGHLKPILRTFAVYGSTLLLSTGLLYCWVDLIGITEIIAPLMNLLITIPLNFLLIKHWALK